MPVLRPTVLLATVAALLVVPAPALADTILVDDDGVECPEADYIQVLPTDMPLVTAVQTAAQGDVINVCAGSYHVPGGAASQGLRIEKNLTIRGQGADVVTVTPDPTLGPTIAGAVPNERDDTGNVITVKKRTVELENVNISGITVGDPSGVAAEAGIAMIDVNESSITNVRVVGAVPGTGPGTGEFAGAMAASGHGIVLANPEASSPDEPEENVATIRNVEINNFNKAGLVVDERRLAGTSPVGSHITAKVSRTRITGAGATSIVPQNGIEVWGGPTAVLPGTATLKLTDSEITAVGNVAPAEGANAAVFLRGASTDTRIGPGNSIAGNSYGVYHGDFAGALAAAPVDATGNWWGNAAGPSAGLPVTTGDPVSANVTTTPFATTAPAALTGVPGDGENSAPVAQFDAPLRDFTVEPGTAVPLTAIASDDFAVAGLDFLVDGVSIGAAGALPGPWTASWTPTEADRGKVIELTAVATDSAGLTGKQTIRATVPALPVVPADPEPPVDVPVPPGPPVAPVAVAPPPPAAPPVSRKAYVSSTAPSASGAPRIRVTLRAPGTATVTLTARRRVRGRLRTTKVGSATHRFAGAGSAVLVVKLTNVGRRLLADRGRLTVRATIVVTGGPGPITVTRTITLTAKRAATRP